MEQYLRTRMADWGRMRSLRLARSKRKSSLASEEDPSSASTSASSPLPPENLADRSLISSSGFEAGSSASAPTSPALASQTVPAEGDGSEGRRTGAQSPPSDKVNQYLQSQGSNIMENQVQSAPINTQLLPFDDMSISQSRAAYAPASSSLGTVGGGTHTDTSSSLAKTSPGIKLFGALIGAHNQGNIGAPSGIDHYQLQSSRFQSPSTIPQDQFQSPEDHASMSISCPSFSPSRSLTFPSSDSYDQELKAITNLSSCEAGATPMLYSSWGMGSVKHHHDPSLVRSELSQQENQVRSVSTNTQPPAHDDLAISQSRSAYGHASSSSATVEGGSHTDISSNIEISSLAAIKLFGVSIPRPNQWNAGASSGLAHSQPQSAHFQSPSTVPQNQSQYPEGHASMSKSNLSELAVPVTSPSTVTPSQYAASNPADVSFPPSDFLMSPASDTSDQELHASTKASSCEAGPTLMPFPSSPGMGSPKHDHNPLLQQSVPSQQHQPGVTQLTGDDPIPGIAEVAGGHNQQPKSVNKGNHASSSLPRLKTPSISSHGDSWVATKRRTPRKKRKFV